MKLNLKIGKQFWRIQSDNVCFHVYSSFWFLMSFPTYVILSHHSLSSHFLLSLLPVLCSLSYCLVCSPSSVSPCVSSFFLLFCFLVFLSHCLIFSQNLSSPCQSSLSSSPCLLLNLFSYLLSLLNTPLFSPLFFSTASSHHLISPPSLLVSPHFLSSCLLMPPPIYL